MKLSRYLILLLFSVLLLASCKKDDPEIIATITLYQTEVNFGYSAADAKIHIDFRCTYDWSAETDVDWISLSKNKGTRDDHNIILVKAETNETLAERRGKIIITSGKTVKEITVIQDKGVRTLTPAEIQDYHHIYIGKGADRVSLSSDGNWYYGRSAQSEHFVLFWDKEYGEFGEVSPSDCPDSRYRVDIDQLLDWAEQCFDQYVNVLKFAEIGKTQLDNWKFEIFLHHTTTWAAYGWGLDDVVGCLWVNPDAAKSRATVAHEIGHSFQYQIYCDLIYNKTVSKDYEPGFRYDRGENGTGFWEQTSQWMAAQMCPEEVFGGPYFNGTDGTSFCENAHRHFLHEDMRYGSYFMHYYWQDKYGADYISRIWKGSRHYKDALQVHMAIQGMTIDEFNAELYDYASKIATWDFNDLRAKGVNYINKIPWKATKDSDGWYSVSDSVCPEATGFNIIRLQNYTKGGEVKLEFLDVDAELYTSFTIGFVALSTDNITRYYSAPVSSFSGLKCDYSWTIPADTKRLWAVVCATPRNYITHFWDDDNSDDRLWPYMIRFEGATPAITN